MNFSAASGTGHYKVWIQTEALVFQSANSLYVEICRWTFDLMYPSGDSKVAMLLDWWQLLLQILRGVEDNKLGL